MDFEVEGGGERRIRHLVRRPLRPDIPPPPPPAQVPLVPVVQGVQLQRPIVQVQMGPHLEQALPNPSMSLPIQPEGARAPPNEPIPSPQRRRRRHRSRPNQSLDLSQAVPTVRGRRASHRLPEHPRYVLRSGPK